jgi:hypothetical protein
MINQYQQKGILILIGILTLITSYFLSGEVEKTIFSSFGIIALLLSFILFLFNRFFWKWKYLYDWFIPVPDLNGEWEGNGNEALTHINDDRTVNVENKDFNGASIKLEQTYTDIHLKIEWSDNSVTLFDEAAPFVVSGKITKRLSFNAMYSYTPKGGRSEVRNVIATFSTVRETFNNKPKNVTLTYATSDGVRQGTLGLTRK